MDLDPVNFSDEAFVTYASIKPNTVQEGGTGAKQKVKHAEVNTDDLEYMDVETNTKFKKNAISVCNS